VETSINSDAANPLIGTAFGLPKPEGPLGHTIAWQGILTGTVSAISTSLQISMDNTNWSSVDTATSTAGWYRIVTPIVARFVRVYHTSDTGCTNLAATILLQ
jgi:hypothetical protein